jgi:hypothetical protein
MDHDIELRVQTPRGLWSTTEPPNATKRPVYEPTAKVQQVIDDAREVFHLVESDNKYTLLHDGRVLPPDRTLVSEHIHSGALLVLSVQGGYA